MEGLVSQCQGPHAPGSALSVLDVFGGSGDFPVCQLLSFPLKPLHLQA